MREKDRFEMSKRITLEGDQKDKHIDIIMMMGIGPFLLTPIRLPIKSCLFKLHNR